ncbi:hypothetical protein CAI21_11930 [Alkalilimnicola ehrlichii]|uniref:flagella synthesis protein FlgN n=1 Tax=Alkalilimnicola ehrlichii TaxID=351052 RepID=UPI000E2E464B|nr:flagellar protein FlgN [Alkalilimnicola ehrlichii]RFA28568.1 hypothetical protein CAI21_11930 [Alkalilimnicola ehrlichii]
MTAHTDPLTMQTVLERSLETLEHLHQLMEQESRRLQAREVTDLEELHQGKLDALQALEACEQDRRALVAAAGFDDQSAEGMRAYLLAQGDEPLAEHWTQLTASLVKLQVMNEVNARVIHRTLSHVQRDLSLISGEIPTNTYDPKGRQASPRGRTITRA